MFPESDPGLVRLPPLAAPLDVFPLRAEGGQIVSQHQFTGPSHARAMFAILDYYLVMTADRELPRYTIVEVIVCGRA